MIFPSARPSPPHHFSRFFLAALDASPANPVFSDLCGLFFSLGALFDVRLICFQYLADSFCKTPGGGVPVPHLRALRACPFFRRASALSFAVILWLLLFSSTYKSPLVAHRFATFSVFMHLQIPFSNFFGFTSIQNARVSP